MVVLTDFEDIIQQIPENPNNNLTLDDSFRKIKPVINRQILEELSERLRPKKKAKEVKKPISKADKKEISDAVLEITQDSLKPKVIDRAQEREEMLYRLLETEQKGLDYSNLHYGQIAKPLATQWDYSQYEQNDLGFVAQETISIEEVEEIIEEKAFADLFHQGDAFLRVNTDYRFKYWKLFNQALNIIKYDMAFL